jgi:dihydroorotate dehydrogenase
MSNTNPFHPADDSLDPEQRQLANREFLHEREHSAEGSQELAKLTYHGRRYENPKLKTRVGRLELENPLMVAAGWDKFGEAVEGLSLLGFSAVEVGTIPLNAQIGNPKPRHLEMGPGVYLNRYGFNSPGAAIVKKNLERYKRDGLTIGINIGKNKEVSLEQAPEVHARVAELLYDQATYFVINVSSPNTPDVRSQQTKSILSKIAKAVLSVVQGKGNLKPVFVKIAPELLPSELSDVIEVVTDYKLEGIIASNTTVNAKIKAKYGEQWKDEAGGLSGDDDDFRDLVNAQIRFIYKQTQGAVPIIGVGGIQDVTTALDTIKAGASALQIMSALNVYGPALPGIINEGLMAYIEKEGVADLAQLVGADGR